MVFKFFKYSLDVLSYYKRGGGGGLFKAVTTDFDCRGFKIRNNFGANSTSTNPFGLESLWQCYIATESVITKLM